MKKLSAWARIKTLVIKEMLASLYDKKTRFSLIVPPLVQLFILSYAATLEVKNIDIAIYNQDGGYYGTELSQRISGSPYVRHVRVVHSEQELRDAVDTQQAIAALHLPIDFSRQVMNGAGSARLVLDGRKSNASQIVGGYISHIVGQLNHDIAPARAAPTPSVFRSWFNPNLDYMWYTVPCLFAILAMILVLTITALSVAREREMGTFDQLLVSPLQPWQILVGKSIPAVLIGITQSTVIMLVALAMFSVPFKGSVVMLYVATLFFVISITGVGLFISALSRTQQQANLGTFVFMVPTMLLSGYSTPVENMVSWLQPVSWLMPLTHFLIIVKGIFLKDMPPLEVLTHVWPMAVIALLTLSAAGWMFSRRLE